MFGHAHFVDTPLLHANHSNVMMSLFSFGGGGGKLSILGGKVLSLPSPLDEILILHDYY